MNTTTSLYHSNLYTGCERSDLQLLSDVFRTNNKKRNKNITDDGREKKTTSGSMCKDEENHSYNHKVVYTCFMTFHLFGRSHLFVMLERPM